MRLQLWLRQLQRQHKQLQLQLQPGGSSRCVPQRLRRVEWRKQLRDRRRTPRREGQVLPAAAAENALGSST